MIKYIGTKELTTERLLLRKFKIDDANQMFNNWAKDPENIKYMTWKAHKTIDDTKEIINKWLDEYKSGKVYHWCITLKNSGEVIGDISALDIRENADSCSIGYVLSKKYWNKGIMTESLKAVIKFLFDEAGFNRIQAYHHTNNPASGKVMKKSGMKFEGILRQYERNNDDKFCDVAMYSILKSEF